MEEDKNKKIKLEEYERICPDCNGIGMTYPPLDLVDLHLAMCKTCKGRCKIDWIDIIKKGYKKGVKNEREK